MGTQYGGLANESLGCDAATCRFRPNWLCIQPGSSALLDRRLQTVPDLAGDVPIPGPDGNPLIDVGWGAVPHLARVRCWCAIPAGTYSTPELDCAPFACPFPERCVDTSPFVTENGTTCAPGAQGTACDVCQKRWFRFRDSCKPCPENQSAVIIVVALFGLIVALRVMAIVAKVATPQALALLRSLGNYLQYLSISLGLNLKWPAALLDFFRWLRLLTSEIDLSAPECVTAWS